MYCQTRFLQGALVLFVSLIVLNVQGVADARRPTTTTTTSSTTTSTTVAPSTTTTTPQATTTTLSASTSFLGDSGRPFSTNSYINTPIPATPSLDPHSASIASYLGASGVYRFAQIWDSGVPVWNADASTPRYTVSCTRPWGVCPFNGYAIPVPDNAGTNNNTDKPMVVVDFSSRLAYDFFEFQRDSSGIRTGWGAISNIDGDGIPFVGNAVGAGISRLAGLVRTYEIRQGHIDHALTFLSDNTCANRYRYPAQKTDGDSWDANCIEEGSRIQLDPTINVDALPGITQFEKMVAKALQTYGAYVQDKATYHAGSRMTFWFEPPAPGEADPYTAAGVPWDWWHMPNIPWSSIRVLQSWTGGGFAQTTTTTTPTTSVGSDASRPTPAQNVTVTGKTSTSVAIAWDAATDNVAVTGYRVWRATQSQVTGAWTLVGQLPADARGFTDTTVTRSTFYYYGVRAVDAAGNISDSSNVVTVTTDA